MVRCRLSLSLACAGMLSGLWVVAAGAQASVPEGVPEACKAWLAEGQLESRRAHFPEAVALFERALTSPRCAVEAQLGLAETYNGMNRHKDALAMAEAVLRSTEDDELAAMAHYQIGLALDVRGRRLNAKKKRALAAFEQSVEVSGGEYEPAIRALMRVYRETRMDDELASLEERFPKVRSSSRAEQVQRIQAARRERAAKASPPKDPVSASETPVSASGEPDGVAESDVWTLDCATGERSEGFERDESVPTPTPEDWQNGLVRPQELEASPPQYTDRARAEGVEGVVVAEVLIDAQGVPRSAHLVRGAHPDLDAAALESFCRYRWVPAKTSDGTATAIYYQMSVKLSVQ